MMIYTGSVDKLDHDKVSELGNIIGIYAKPFEMKSFMLIGNKLIDVDE